MNLVPKATLNMNAPKTPVAYGNTNSKFASFCPQYHFFGSFCSVTVCLLIFCPVTFRQDPICLSPCGDTPRVLIANFSPLQLFTPSTTWRMRYGICSISFVDKMTYLVRVKQSIGGMKRRRLVRS